MTTTRATNRPCLEAGPKLTALVTTTSTKTEFQQQGNPVALPRLLLWLLLALAPHSLTPLRPCAAGVASDPDLCASFQVTFAPSEVVLSGPASTGGPATVRCPVMRLGNLTDGGASRLENHTTRLLVRISPPAAHGVDVEVASVLYTSSLFFLKRILKPKTGRFAGSQAYTTTMDSENIQEVLVFDIPVVQCSDRKYIFVCSAETVFRSTVDAANFTTRRCVNESRLHFSADPNPIRGLQTPSEEGLGVEVKLSCSTQAMQLRDYDDGDPVKREWRWEWADSRNASLWFLVRSHDEKVAAADVYPASKGCALPSSSSVTVVLSSQIECRKQYRCSVVQGPAGTALADTTAGTALANATAGFGPFLCGGGGSASRMVGAVPEEHAPLWMPVTVISAITGFALLLSATLMGVIHFRTQAQRRARSRQEQLQAKKMRQEDESTGTINSTHPTQVSSERFTGSLRFFRLGDSKADERSPITSWRALDSEVELLDDVENKVFGAASRVHLTSTDADKAFEVNSVRDSAGANVKKTGLQG